MFFTGSAAPEEKCQSEIVGRIPRVEFHSEKEFLLVTYNGGCFGAFGGMENSSVSSIQHWITGKSK